MHEVSNLLSCRAIILSFEFVDKHSVFVKVRATNQISCLSFDQVVAIGANLVEALTCSDAENSFPGLRTCQCSIQFVRELHAFVVGLEIRVEEETTTRFLSQILQRLYILELVLAVREYKQVNRNLVMRVVECRVREKG